MSSADRPVLPADEVAALRRLLAETSMRNWQVGTHRTHNAKVTCPGIGQREDVVATLPWKEGDRHMVDAALIVVARNRLPDLLDSHEALRALVGQHDPTGVDHMAEMWEHAQRADAAEAEVNSLRATVARLRTAADDLLAADQELTANVDAMADEAFIERYYRAKTELRRAALDDTTAEPAKPTCRTCGHPDDDHVADADGHCTRCGCRELDDTTAGEAGPQATPGQVLWEGPLGKLSSAWQGYGNGTSDDPDRRVRVVAVPTDHEPPYPGSEAATAPPNPGTEDDTRPLTAVEEKVVDLMTALEDSVREAKAARVRRLAANAAVPTDHKDQP